MKSGLILKEKYTVKCSFEKDAIYTLESQEKSHPHRRFRRTKTR